MKDKEKGLSNHLEQFQQEWFQHLIKEKVEFLYHTVENEGTLAVFNYVYNIYSSRSVYQVTVSQKRVPFVRHLYKNVQMNKSITFDEVKGNQVIKDKNIIETIQEIIQKHIPETV